MVTLAAMAKAMGVTSTRKMAAILGLPPPTPQHPLSIRELERRFLKEARPWKPTDLNAVLLTNLDTDFNPGRVTLSWIDLGALTFARAVSFRVVYWYQGGDDVTLWEEVSDATPGPFQRLATDLTNMTGSVGDSTGGGQLFLAVQGINEFGSGPTATQAIDR